MKTLNGKYAVVTGGSKGIGKSVCLTLAKAGANIFILDTDKNQGLVVQDEASRLGVEAFFYEMDVAQESEWIKFNKFLNNHNKTIDILINNAGIYLGKEITDVSISEYQKLISINLTGVFLGIKHLMPF